MRLVSFIIFRSGGRGANFQAALLALGPGTLGCKVYVGWEPRIGSLDAWIVLGLEAVRPHPRFAELQTREARLGAVRLVKGDATGAFLVVVASAHMNSGSTHTAVIDACGAIGLSFAATSQCKGRSRKQDGQVER
jgi:hypothetical protein